MPSLPFTFKDLQELDIPKEAAKNSAINTEIEAQNFLANAVDRVKKQFGTTEGLIDTGLAMNPVTRYVDMTSQFFGGPGVSEGFRDGVTQEVGDPRSGQSIVRVPPMPF